MTTSKLLAGQTATWHIRQLKRLYPPWHLPLARALTSTTRAREAWHHLLHHLVFTCSKLNHLRAAKERRAKKPTTKASSFAFYRDNFAYPIAHEPRFYQILVHITLFYYNVLLFTFGFALWDICLYLSLCESAFHLLCLRILSKYKISFSGQYFSKSHLSLCLLSVFPSIKLRFHLFSLSCICISLYMFYYQVRFLSVFATTLLSIWYLFPKSVIFFFLFCGESDGFLSNYL